MSASSIDTKYNNQLAAYLEKLNTSKSYQPLVQELVRSPNLSDWKILSVIQNKIEEKQPRAKRIIEEIIEKNLENIHSFATFMYAYYLKVSRKLSYYGSMRWRRLYNELCIQKALISIFQTWIQSEPNSLVVQQSIDLLAQTFGLFYKQQFISLTEIQMNSIVGWVCYLHTPNSEKYENVCRLVKLVKQNRTILTQDYVQKQHLIIKKLIQICGKNSNNSANMFLFIYPTQLKQKDISYFCHVYSDYLLSVSQQVLCNFFTCITKSAITVQILMIINKISLLLKNSEEFYKLRVIYQKFILPILARRMKICNKVEKQVFQICQFYILGMLKHCDLPITGIQCIVRNVSKVKDNAVHDQWVKLMQILCIHFPKLKQQTQKILTKQYNKQVHLLKQSAQKIAGQYNKLINDTETVWEVTIRNSRRLKQYVKKQSKYKGIKNQQNECYIITVVQALQKSRLLQKLLSKYAEEIKEKKIQLSYQLLLLFQEISGRRKAKEIVVRYLKKKGPYQFRNSQNQEDAHHYLVQLFDILQTQLKQTPKILQNAYQQIFVRNVTPKNKQQKSLMHQSIPHTDILREETSQTINDFKCQNCEQLTQAVLMRRLEPQSQILIIHINRFSHKKGVAKKQLSTQIILRNFMQYTLVGMICHRGKNMEHGHYVYYHRLNAKKWLLLNDSSAEQFELSEEDEQFQRQWKSQMTPFILFYQQIDD